MEPISEISCYRLSKLYKPVQDKARKVLVDCALAFNRSMNVVEGLRSLSEQMDLYQQGRSLEKGQWVVKSPGRVVTNALPGGSYHNFGLAFDCAFAGVDPYLYKLSSQERDQHWQMYGNIIQKNGLIWGGNFKIKSGARDLPHAETSYGGLSVHQLFDYYNKHSMEELWAYLDQVGKSKYALHVEAHC